MDTKTINTFLDRLEERMPHIGSAILEIYKTFEDGDQISKSDDSPLTKADQKSNDMICAILKEISPNIPIVSEENKSISYEQRKNWEWLWMVDPLDGTKEFIKKNGEFTVNIALIHKGISFAGIVYTPVTGEVYRAVKGDGAYYGANGQKQKLEVLEFSKNKSGLKISCSRSHLNDATKDYVNQYNNPELIPLGSSLKLLHIAKGDIHVYPRLGPTMEWDIAAAQIIVEEAGGSVLTEEDRPLIYNKENLLNPYFIAKGKERDA